MWQVRNIVIRLDKRVDGLLEQWQQSVVYKRETKKTYGIQQGKQEGTHKSLGDHLFHTFSFWWMMKQIWGEMKAAS
jgi:hypothetical protein